MHNWIVELTGIIDIQFYELSNMKLPGYYCDHSFLEEMLIQDAWCEIPLRWSW